MNTFKAFRYRTRFLTFLLFLVWTCTGLAVPSMADADIVRLSAAKDNTLYGPVYCCDPFNNEWDPDCCELHDFQGVPVLSNGAGPNCFAGVDGKSRVKRALIAFGIADSIPAGSTINSTALTLHMSRSATSGLRTVGLYRLLADWGEGASIAEVSDEGEGGGRGAPPEPNDATWSHRFFPSVAWSRPGGDFGRFSANTRVGPIGFYTWGSTPQMVEDVQTWLDAPSTNFGWLVMSREDEPSNFPDAKRFDTKENPDPAVRPVLIVDFTPPLPLVAIDIKPGNERNPINPHSKGKLPVAILTDGAFDALQVDPTSVRFGPDQGGIAHAQGHVEDVDGDGDADLLLHFRARDTGIACGDTEATLTGETYDGQQIAATDTIKTVGCDKK